jgi:predicted ATPase
LQIAGTSIKVRSLEFGNRRFRKLSDFTINFADRLTIIAGHNGIGKSTILGLVANTFGLTDSPSTKNYFGDPFYASIEKILYLALEEVNEAQEDPAAGPFVMAEAGELKIKKRCALTRRSQWRRARVVPRTVGKEENDPYGQDAKIPLPTIYLGIKRLASIGEADEKEVTSSTIDMDEEDKQLIASFVRSVIQGVEVNAEITRQDIKGARKRTIQPGYLNHDALAISMGQDSLGSIATALASFNYLRRELGDNYPGGLLVIDELDVGFHPHAIERLVTSLKKQARLLRLQVIATTHSPRLIEAVHPQGNGNFNSPDSVIYLLDTVSPRLAPDQSLHAILGDMALRPETKREDPALIMHFEDTEGAQFCKKLLAGRTGALARKHGIKLKLCPLGIGGSNLVKLPSYDPIFKKRILAVDADTTVPAAAGKNGNIVKLPCGPGAAGVNRSPENTIICFLREMTAATGGPLREALRMLKTTNPSTDKIHATFFSGLEAVTTNRESTKKWWAQHWDKLSDWKVIEAWAQCNPTQVKQFIRSVELAVDKVSKSLLADRGLNGE